MKQKTFTILKTLVLLQDLKHSDRAGRGATIGEVSRWTGIPHSTVRRHMMKLVRMQCVSTIQWFKGKLECYRYEPSGLGRSFFDAQQYELPFGGEA